MCTVNMQLVEMPARSSANDVQKPHFLKAFGSACRLQQVPLALRMNGHGFNEPAI